jgi:hypothetical protein
MAGLGVAQLHLTSSGTARGIANGYSAVINFSIQYSSRDPAVEAALSMVRSPSYNFDKKGIKCRPHSGCLCRKF